MAERFVLDSGVALAWVLPESMPAKLYAAKVYDYAANGHVVVVPALFHEEVAAVLLRRMRSDVGRISRKRIETFFDRLEFLNIQTVASLESARELFRRADRYHLQGFDSVFFSLALAEKIPLASLDGGLKTACKSFSVPFLSFP